ncbi:Rac GTPase binding [Schizosaccharomyces osmophilus]|uniref:Rac GTPase binding n=1 Tax=Schizosaccharomyces osmophilus TaxID=2545709 RepID=A0AAE9WDN1_9SCHI|nr:Rac GTPase binding [Schizosaccharomyces osmophilus]WBW74441.1 Rac GTPase binding [Schizosaccharomyces osmophilus]
MFPENFPEDGVSLNRKKSSFWKRLSQDFGPEKPRRSRHVPSYSVSDFPSDLHPTRAAPEPPKGRLTQYARRFSNRVKTLFSKNTPPSSHSSPSSITFFQNNNHHRLPVQTEIVPSPSDLDCNYQVHTPNRLITERTFTKGQLPRKKSFHIGRSRSLNIRPESTSISFPLHLYKEDTSGSNPRLALHTRTSASSTFSSVPSTSFDNESRQFSPVECLHTVPSRKTEGYASILNRRSAPNSPSSLNLGEWDATPLANIQERSAD